MMIFRRKKNKDVNSTFNDIPKFEGIPLEITARELGNKLRKALICLDCEEKVHIIATKGAVIIYFKNSKIINVSSGNHWLTKNIN